MAPGAGLQLRAGGNSFFTLFCSKKKIATEEKIDFEKCTMTKSDGRLIFSLLLLFFGLSAINGSKRETVMFVVVKSFEFLVAFGGNAFLFLVDALCIVSFAILYKKNFHFLVWNSPLVRR